MDTSQRAEIKALSDYQSVCGAYITQELMVFTNMAFLENPDAEAQKYAALLKEFAEKQLSPIVVVEPYLSNGLLEWKEFAGGKYTANLSRFFVVLKEQGVSDAMMGMWVPFPEPNVPNWGVTNGDAKDFIPAINLFVGEQKKAFPQSKASILLNTTSYLPTDLEWENGDYYALDSYYDGITTGLIDSLGIQGFPWIAAADQRKRVIFDANEFLSPSLITSALKGMRIKDVWLNTGTFGVKYAQEQFKRVIITAPERKQIMNSIFDVAEGLQNGGYRVSTNLFAEDKTNVREATDWSYLGSGDYRTVFKDFVREAEQKSLKISLYVR